MSFGLKTCDFQLLVAVVPVVKIFPPDLTQPMKMVNPILVLRPRYAIFVYRASAMA